MYRTDVVTEKSGHCPSLQ